MFFYNQEVEAANVVGKCPSAHVAMQMLNVLLSDAHTRTQALSHADRIHRVRMVLRSRWLPYATLAAGIYIQT